MSDLSVQEILSMFDEEGLSNDRQLTIAFLEYVCFAVSLDPLRASSFETKRILYFVALRYSHYARVCCRVRILPNI